MFALSKKSEAGSNKSEAGSKKSEAGSKKSEAGSKKSEGGSKKSEVGSKKSEAGSTKSEAGSKKSEGGSTKSEVGSKKNKVGREKFTFERPSRGATRNNDFMAEVPFFGRVARARGWITESQLEECLREQMASADAPPLGQILIRKRLLSPEQFLVILKEQEQLRFTCKACGASTDIGSTFEGEPCARCGGLLEVPSDVVEAARLSQTTLYLQLRGGQIGKYVIHREIARGAGGIVYEAEDPGLKRRVAIKILRESAGINERMVMRFHREATAAAKLRHPNIVGVHDVGVDAGLHYFVMDLVEGGTFRDVLAGRRPAKASVAMLVAVARAVDAAHREGIVHRDLKPSNILVDRQDRPFVTDFGVARVEVPHLGRHCARGVKKKVSLAPRLLNLDEEVVVRLVMNEDVVGDLRSDGVSMELVRPHGLVERHVKKVSAVV